MNIVQPRHAGGVQRGEREEEKRGQVIFEFHDHIIVSHVPPLTFSSLPKGVLGFESLTRGRVGRSAGGRLKKNMEPLIKLS